MKVRVRFGMKLVWPIKNAAVFVFYVKDEQAFAQLLGYVDMIRPFLPADVNARLVCERS